MAAMQEIQIAQVKRNSLFILKLLGIKKYENIWFIVFCTVFSHELVAAAVGVGWTLESVEH
jgi:hypothetical protein